MEIIDIYFTDSFLQKIEIGILIFGLICAIYLLYKLPRKQKNRKKSLLNKGSIKSLKKIKNYNC